MIEYVLTWMITAAVDPMRYGAAYHEAADWLMTVDAPPGWLRSTEGWS